MQIDNLFSTVFSQATLNSQWFPVIIIVLVLLVLLCIYILFMYIRSFISWIFGFNEMIIEQRKTQKFLEDLILLQEEQNALLEAIFVENDEKKTSNSTNSFDEEDSGQLIEKNENLQKNQTKSRSKKRYFHNKKSKNSNNQGNSEQ